MPNPERRRSPRVAVDVPVELRFTLDPAVPGRASDLSREGLFAETGDPRTPGTLVRVRLDVNCAEPVIAVGVVVRQVPSSEAPLVQRGRKGVGILLTSTSEAWDRYWDGMAEKTLFGSA